MKKNTVKSRKVDGVSFNMDAVAAYGSEAEFIKATPEHIFEGANREAKLKSVYAMARPEPEAPAKEEKAPARGKQ